MNKGDVVSTVVINDTEKRYGIFVGGNANEICYLKPIIKQTVENSVIISKHIEYIVVKEPIEDFCSGSPVHRVMDVASSCYGWWKTIDRAEKLCGHSWTPVKVKNQTKAFVKYVYFNNAVAGSWKEYIGPVIGTGVGFLMGGWFGSVLGASVGTVLQEKLFG